MRKILMGTLVIPFLMMASTAGADDLNTYRYVSKDGRVFEINDETYTEVGRKTIAGKDYWVAFKMENQDEKTDIFKVATNVPDVKPNEWAKLSKVTVNLDDANDKVLEFEGTVPRKLTGWHGNLFIYGNIHGQSYTIPEKGGRLILVNNAVHIQPSDYDTSLDLAKAGMLNLDKRNSAVEEIEDRSSWWTSYTTKHIGWKILEKGFPKNSDYHMLHIGRNYIGRDKSITGIYFVYGRESAHYFRKSIFDENINIIRSDSRFHVANGKTDMFGIGVSKTKYFSNGAYIDALCQYAVFDRKVNTVNDGVYRSQHASVRSDNIGMSLEVGRKIEVRKNLSFQPEVQYMYNMYDQDAYTDSLRRRIDQVKIHDKEWRVGLKAMYKDIYIKVNKYFNYTNGTRIDTEGEIGIDTKMNKDYSIHSSLSYRAGDNRRENQVRFSAFLKKSL